MPDLDNIVGIYAAIKSPDQQSRVCFRDLLAYFSHVYIVGTIPTYQISLESTFVDLLLDRAFPSERFPNNFHVRVL